MKIKEFINMITGYDEDKNIVFFNSDNDILEITEIKGNIVLNEIDITLKEKDWD